MPIIPMNTNGLELGDVVLDEDLYEGRVERFVKIEGIVYADLDYSEFPSDVPAEGNSWPVEMLTKVEDA